MRYTKEFQSIDGVAAPDDQFQVETQTRPQGTMLYVHVNGQTLFRAGQISPDHIQYLHDGKTFQIRSKKPDYVGLEDLRERFKHAVGQLPNYKRTDAWSYIAALELVIQHKDKEIEKMADEITKKYEQGYTGGLHDAKLRPGDGMMGG